LFLILVGRFVTLDLWLLAASHPWDIDIVWMAAGGIEGPGFTRPAL